MNNKNNEGHHDPTATEAIQEADKTPKHVLDVIYALRSVASLAGFELKGRICLRDRETGKEYR